MNVNVSQMEQEDTELVLYALATVDLTQNRRNSSVLNRLEYMCEIYVDMSGMSAVSASASWSTWTSTKSLSKATTLEAGEIRLVPSFMRLKLEETLERDVSVFRFVSLLEASDERRSLVKYAIVDGLNRETFELESKTGWLRLVRDLSVDESRSVLNVSACIESQCAFSRIEVEVLDVNNHRPRFEQTVLEANIREDSLPGTVVATVWARDADAHSKLEYFILSGDVHNQFAISPDGKVYTQLLIDRETRSHYELEIAAFDGKYRDEMRLRVIVTDVSDQRPVCGPETSIQVELAENTPIGTVVYSVLAENLEQNVTRLKYEIIGREQVETGADNLIETYLEQIPFSVDEMHGKVRVSDELDYEHKREYVFFVRVAKADLSLEPHLTSTNLLLTWTQYCLVKVEIHLLDVNDNPPEFTSTNRRVVELLEGSARGTVLEQLAATDQDAKINSVIRYELVGVNPMFSLDPKIGLLQLDSPGLDRELIATHNLTIRAYNLIDRLSTHFDMRVDVTDLNDNAPRFDRSEYFVSVEENLPNGFLLTQINAIDPDVNSTTEYSILGDDGLFNSFTVKVRK